MVRIQLLDFTLDVRDLILHNRQSLGEVVMFAHFSGKLLQLCICYSLRCFQICFYTTISAGIGNNHAEQGQAAGDYCCDNTFHALHPHQAAPGRLADDTIDLQTGLLLVQLHGAEGVLAEDAIRLMHIAVAASPGQQELEGSHFLTF